jgi:hypothetical protein
MLNSVLDTTGIRVLPRNFRNSLFTDICKNPPSARCVSAASCVCKYIDIFRKPHHFFKTDSALLCDILKSTYLRFFKV